jgi:Inner membrane component of T3SS, cytoplasmic domain
MEFATSAVGFVASAVFHAAVHLAGHESYEAFKLSLDKRLLKNHDVAQALRDSYRASLRIMKHLYKSTETDPARIKSANSVFKRLQKQAPRLFDNLTGALEDAPSERGLSSNLSPSDSLTNEVIKLAQPIDESMEAFLRESFAPAFKYAFVELGLKRNTSVRAILTHGILRRVEESVTRTEQEIEELRQALSENRVERVMLEEMKGFEQHFRAVAGTLNEMIDRFEEVRDSNQRLIALIEKSRIGEGVLRGFVLTCAEDGCPLVCKRAYKREIRIGRGEHNDIVLPDRTVSADHALVTFEASHAKIRDLGSRNGTLVEGVPVRFESPVSFGQEIVVGDHVLVLYPPDTPVGGLPTLTPD